MDKEQRKEYNKKYYQEHKAVRKQQYDKQITDKTVNLKQIIKHQNEIIKYLVKVIDENFNSSKSILDQVDLSNVEQS